MEKNYLRTNEVVYEKSGLVKKVGKAILPLALSATIALNSGGCMTYRAVKRGDISKEEAKKYYLLEGLIYGGVIAAGIAASSSSGGGSDRSSEDTGPGPTPADPF